MKLWCAVIIGTGCFYSLVMEKEIQTMEQAALQSPVLAAAQLGESLQASAQ